MRHRLSRRAWLALAAASTFGWLGAACQTPAAPNTSAAPAAARPAGPPPASLVLASSELVVGPNRFLVALLENGRPVPNAAASFEFFEVDGQSATKRGDAVAEWRLPSEPWVFVVDRDGVIVDRLEGVSDAEELDGSLSQVL